MNSNCSNSKCTIEIDSCKKIALIFGITGQTGSYLAEHLLNLGYDVHGVVRRSSTYAFSRIDHIFQDNDEHLHYGDITDSSFVIHILTKLQPHEVYNLAAQSHVAVSFELPVSTSCVNAIGPLNILNAIYICNLDKKTRYFQAGTSEMYGGSQKDYNTKEWKKIQECGMNETTTFHPKSPYGVAKLFAHNMVQIYRESYHIFAVNGISFNHESERRDASFVTRKITQGVAKISCGKINEITLGNLDAKRDWGHAQDIAKGIHLALQQKDAKDIVFSTGKVHSVRDVVEIAFKTINVDIEWENKLENEIGRDKNSGIIRVRVSKKLYRPNEVHFLKGNSKLALDSLNWKPEINFSDMIRKMVLHDLTLEKNKIK